MNYSYVARTKRSIIFLMIIGVILAGASVWATIENKKANAVYEEIDATITEIQETGMAKNKEYHVFVDYYIGFRAFHHVEYGGYSSSMKKGDTITVLYNVDDPTKIKAPGSFNIPLVIGAGGLGSILYGVFWLQKNKED